MCCQSLRHRKQGLASSMSTSSSEDRRVDLDASFQLLFLRSFLKKSAKKGLKEAAPREKPGKASWMLWVEETELWIQGTPNNLPLQDRVLESRELHVETTLHPEICRGPCSIQHLGVRRLRGDRTTQKDERKWCLDLTQGWEQYLLLPVRLENCPICEARGRVLLKMSYLSIGDVVDLE